MLITEVYNSHLKQQVTKKQKFCSSIMKPPKLIKQFLFSIFPISTKLASAHINRAVCYNTV